MQIIKRYSGTIDRTLYPNKVEFAGVKGDNRSCRLVFELPPQYDDYIKHIKFDVNLNGFEGPLVAMYPLTDNYFDIPIEITSANLKTVGYRIEFREREPESPDDPVIEASMVSLLHFASAPDGQNVIYTPEDIFTYFSNSFAIDSEYKVNVNTDRAEIIFTSHSGIEYPLSLEMPFLEDGKVPRRFLEEDYIQDLYFVDDDSELSSLDVQSGDFALNTTSKDLFILTSDDLDTGWYKIHSPNPIYDTITVENDALLKSNLEVRGNEIIKGTSLTEGDIHTDSDLSVGGDISVDGNADIVMNANVEGTLDVTGNVSMASDTTVGGDLGVIGNAVIDGSLDTFGDVKLHSDALIEGNVVVGDGIIDSNVQIKGTLDTTGDSVTGGKHTSTSSEVYDDLQVGGNAIVDGDVTVGDGITDSNVLVEGTLDITGGATVGGKLTSGSSEVTNDILIKGGSTVKGDSSTDGSVSAGGSISGASIDVTGNSSTGGSSTIIGNSAIGGTLNVDGNTSLNSDATIGGDVVVGDGITDSNVLVKGTLDVTKDTTVAGKLTSGSSEIGGTLNVDGNTSLNSDATIGGDVVVGDDLTDSSVSIKGSIGATKDASVGGKLTSGSSEVTNDLVVKKNSYLEADVSIGGELSVDQGISVASIDSTGNLNVGGDSSVGGNSSIAGTAQIDGNTSLKSNVDVGGNVVVGTDVRDSNVLIKGTLDVTKEATVGGKLIAKSSEVTEDLLVKGGSTVMGDLSTDGSLSAGAGISGASIDIIGDSSVGGSSTVTGSSSIGGTLDVTDVASFKSDASVKGNVTIGDDISDSNVSVKGTLDVTKNATVGGKLTTGALEVIGDSLTKGNTTVDLDANVGGELAVGSDISGESINARGDLDVTGKTNITGDTTLGGNLDVIGGVYADSDLHVIGTAEVGGATMLRSTLDTDGKVTVGNDIQRADLEVKGNAKIGNDLTVDGGINTILNPDSVVIADSTGKLNTTTVSKTELETLDGVTSSVQTQINTKEASANKVSSWSATTNNVRYPSEKLTKDTLDEKVKISQGLTEASKFVLTDNAGDIKVFRTLAVTDIPSLPASKITSGAFADARIPTNIERNTNKVTAFGTTPSDDKYPSEKLVKDNFDLKADDNAVVHKAGNESITGIKTFENNVNIGTVGTPRDVSIKGNITIEGNIVQNGSAYETHAENIHTTNDKIILREGAVGGLVSGDTSGFIAKLYDGVNDGVLALDNSGTIRVGDEGDTQPVLTRKESADLSDGGLLAWDTSNLRSYTRILTANDIPSLNASKINAGRFADARIPTNIERNTNKVTSFQSVPTDTAYPSEKLVKGALDLKAEGNVVSSHISDKNNPHAVTKKQLGLEFADNTSDIDKPVSTATQTALDTKAPTDHKSTGTLHGVGDATHYGHVKVDSTLSTTSVNTVQNKVITSALGTKQDNLTFDTTPTSASLNPVTSGGVFTALGLKADTSYVNTELGKKQNTLSWDSTPIINSTKPVTSGGVYTALGLKQDKLTFDTVPKASSTNPVTSEGIKDAIDIKANTAYVNTELGKKQNKLTFDTAPVADSINPATSGGIYSALATKVDSNNDITAGTRTKITYDAKGLVTGGANLIESDIPSLSASKITSGTFADARIPAMAISKITGLQTALDTKALNTDLTSHATSKTNPHSVTKAQVGLSNVDNTSDMAKPISTATQNALDNTVKKTGNEDIAGTKNFLSAINLGLGTGGQKGVRFHNSDIGDTYEDIVGGMTGNVGFTNCRGLNDFLTHNIVYSVSSTHSSISQTARRPSATNVTRSATWQMYVNSDGDAWITQPMRSSPGSSDAVNTEYVLDQVAGMVNYVDDEVGTHEARKDNPHAVTKAQVGLGSVNNTSDASKPISTATQTALNAKADTSALNTHTGNKSNPHGVTKAQVGLGNVDNTSDINIMNRVYPVGSIYTSVVDINPNELFGVGTWARFGAGRVLAGVDTTQTEFNTVEKTGGSKTVSLTVAQMPTHNHTVSVTSGGAHTHTASSGSTGAHTHTGSSGSAGAHTHSYKHRGSASGGFWGSGGAAAQSLTDQTTGSAGAHTHSVTINSAGAHSHTVSVASGGGHTHTASSGNAGSGNAHNNLPPYITVYMWKRTA